MSNPKWAVQHPEEILIYRFDGVQASGVYTGSFDSLQCVNDKLLWRAEESQLGNLAVLTLEEIEAQLEDSRIINVIVTDPMHTTFYQFGNYGPHWVELGQIMGYA